MNVDALLCNHAEAVGNLLYLSGGGVNLGQVPPGAPPPYGVNLAMGLLVTVPWEKTNQQHKVEIVLLSADGQEVQIPTGPDTSQPVRLELGFNVGRPAGLGIGDEQHVALAANFPGLPLPSIGVYEFVVRLDNHDERRLSYRIAAAPGGPVFSAGAGGPASIPGL